MTMSSARAAFCGSYNFLMAGPKEEQGACYGHMLTGPVVSGDLVACKCTWNTDTYDPTVATVTGPSVYRKVHIYPLPAIFFSSFFRSSVGCTLILFLFFGIFLDEILG